MKKISCPIIVLLCLLSCKKTKLENEFSFMVGTWEWQYTVKTVDVCEPFPYDSVITHSPTMDGYTYSLMFERKGKLVTKKDGEIKDKYRLVFKSDNVQPNMVIYTFKLDNNNKKEFRLTYSSTKPAFIETTEFPEDLIHIDGCQGIHHVFKKTD